MRAFWRVLAVFTALPMVFAIFFAPDYWPIWVFSWIALFALGFG